MANNSLGKRLTAFTPDFSPQHPTNQEAAAQRGWKYDSQRGFYVDEDGYLMADEYGQPLG